MTFYFLRNQGLITPIERATLRLRIGSAVEIVVEGKSFTGSVEDLEVIEEAEIRNVIAAIKSGIPYR